MMMLMTLLYLVGSGVSVWGAGWSSHPPLREHNGPLDREKAEFGGRGLYVDAERGSDEGEGSEGSPWRTIGHALEELGPGDTLYLRGGTYYEQLRISLVGREGSPITIRSYPGEVAVIDGSLREFFEDPEGSWRPLEAGDEIREGVSRLSDRERWSAEPSGDVVEGEYVSTRVYPNLHDVVGAFGDSMVGLLTYWHLRDLRAEVEFFETPERGEDLEPVYMGPGIWYNRETGRIHARLAHTNLPATVAPEYAVEVDFDPGQSNYRGETDPRRLPLVIAGFDAVPVTITGADHVVLQDLVIRGGGHDTVQMRFSRDIEFDNVTVWAGAYGLRARGVERFHFHNSSLYGNVPPWGFRSDHSWRSRPGRGLRDLTRLSTHGLLITEGREVSQIFYHPLNSDWVVTRSEFTDGMNGVFFTGLNMEFSHNLVDQFTDDALFLSTPSVNSTDNVRVHHNLVRRTLMGVSFHGTFPTDGRVYIYRNVFDMRHAVNRARGSVANPEGNLGQLRPFKMSRDIESIYVYQNTFIFPNGRVHHAAWSMGATVPDKERRVFNNIFVTLGGYPATRGVNLVDEEQDAVIDYNLYYSPGGEAPENFLSRITESAASSANRERHPEGELWEANSLVADPMFMAFEEDERAKNDYRPQADSPVIGVGMILSEEWPDPVRPAGDRRPSLGALEPDSEPFRVGRFRPDQ